MKKLLVVLGLTGALLLMFGNSIGLIGLLLLLLFV